MNHAMVFALGTDGLKGERGDQGIHFHLDINLFININTCEIN